jgi:hypothetical protein
MSNGFVKTTAKKKLARAHANINARKHRHKAELQAALNGVDIDEAGAAVTDESGSTLKAVREAKAARRAGPFTRHKADLEKFDGSASDEVTVARPEQREKQADDEELSPAQVRELEKQVFSR